MDNNIIFLDCTRLEGKDILISRKNYNDLFDVYNQIKNISISLKKNNQKYIVLADDVVFSGKVLKNIIENFKSYSIEVIGIRASISTYQSYEKFNKELVLGLKCEYLLDDNVIDQICERDFYFGIAQSGISIMKNNKIFKSPYFKPFGNPVNRASIPKEYEEYFSKKCINRSILLWKEIKKLSKKILYMKDLPEKINLTKDEEPIIKVLKRGIK